MWEEKDLQDLQTAVKKLEHTGWAIRLINFLGAPIEALIRILPVTARFGVVISEKALAEMIPLLGALGGALINLLFVTHFQAMAGGHFVVRRLERKYGAEAVKREYERLAGLNRR